MKMPTKRLLIAFLLALLVTGSNAASNKHSLIFQGDGAPSRALSIEELRKIVPSEEIELFDAMYRKEKRYLALPLKRVLREMFGESLADPRFSHIAYTALDGYAAISTIDKSLQEGGWLVFMDRDFPQWEPIGSRKANPAPFYIMWQGEAQLPKDGYPWPWQLKEIRLVTYAEQYPDTLPPQENERAWPGFELFRERCLRCHAINGQGGLVGPDLNQPRNILDYRSVSEVKAFIREPRSFRNGRMPDHADLSNEQLEDLVQYFWAMRNP